MKLELQADCLAGIGANREQGDVVPENFTHGTSAGRMAWFRKGLQTGDLGCCDTFAGGMLVR